MSRSFGTIVGVLLMLLLSMPLSLAQQQAPVQFGGAYASLDARRQHLVDNWVARFVKLTGQRVEAGPFYDDLLTVSTKTTFDAVTHALMTTTLTDSSGGPIGDALALIDEVDSARGEVPGAHSDHQFRLYVRLIDGAVERLNRSKEFKRGIDNALYHKGYPMNYRAQGGVPSIQISIALDRKHADIDVDYRSSMFPIGLFNGHLTSSNSDVRAGSNFDRHVNRWTGFQNWWRGFFGVRRTSGAAPDAAPSAMALPKVPRAGKANIDVMVGDFLTAWLVEGDVAAAMGSISDRSYACLARDSDDPANFDRGLAPFKLMIDLKAAHDTLGARTSLVGTVVGTRFAIPGVRVVTQPRHAQFVIYSVPDDIAATLDCASTSTPGAPVATRVYGNFYAATFYVDGSRDTPVALLWARENGYWKIVSWKVGADQDTLPAPEPMPDPKVVRIAADPSLVQAARTFVENWLIRKNYDAAFADLSPKSYACYNLERNPGDRAAAADADAGRLLRAALEKVGSELGPAKSLDAVLSAAEPRHPAIRVMNHRDSRIFSLSSLPDALADAVECAARAAGITAPDPLPLEYGRGFGMTVRFRTRSGDAPILRLLWRREGGAWKITAYAIEQS